VSAPSSTAWPDDGPAQPEVPDRGPQQRAVTGANPAVRRRVLVSIIAIGVVVLIGFWWHQTSASEVGDTAGELTAGGRLAGLVGGYLLLVQVLLMSRVPIIDRASSGARQSRWHRASVRTS